MPDRYLGQRLGDYIAEERIGRGAMAVVYRAYQPQVERHVALKVIKLNPALGDDDEFRKRFAQEAEVIAGLEHIHILPVYDYGIVNGEIAYIAMRLMRGGTLGDLIREGALPLERAVDVLTQIARGLTYAHEKQVIHRDLKPTNIIFDNSGNAYLTDFGLAKVMSLPDLTKPGNVVGTPAYVAPEALRGEMLDHRADIYSLGILAFETLTGRLPFEAENGNMMALMHKHLDEDPPKLRALNPAIPPELEAVVLKALRKDPRQRFDSAEQMAHAMNTALGRAYTTGSHPVIQLLPQPTKSSRVLRRAIMVSLGLFVVVLVGGILATVTHSNPPVPTEIPLPTILTGVQGEPDEFQPSSEEIALARQHLGEDGFIAFVACTMESEYQVTRAREMADFAQQYGLAYRFFDSQSDAYTQVTQINRSRIEGAQAIILCPLDTDLLEPTLESLKDANVPLVFVTYFEPGYGVMLNSDSYAIGKVTGQLAGQIVRDEHAGQANIVLLAYPGVESGEQRAQGMMDGVLDFAPNANILGVWRGFTREFGYQSIHELLTEGIHFDGIVSMNDAGSFGAIDALKEADISPDDVFIVSANAESLAVEYIQSGYFLRASIDTNRELGSRAALNAAVRLLAGASVPETILIPPGDPVIGQSRTTPIP